MDQETQLIKNLENQLRRLINELEDLEATKDEMDIQEYYELRNEFLDQSTEFSSTLERLTKGELMNNNVAMLKQELRKAIATSFNTVEIIKIFGYKLEEELEKQLSTLNEEYKLKRISKPEMEVRRIEILNKLKNQNEQRLTKEDLEFLDLKSKQEQAQLDSLD